MVYKKFQVYDWFKTLDGAKRIDFLNGMLHLCFPLELRFLGSCIEELARKDYLYLKDAELKANSLLEIQQFKEICDKITRSKMIVTLALLASNNYECARLLFDLLDVDICQTIDKMKSNYLDAKIADEFLLLLTMAANHPAFDFQMKTRMSNLYLCAEQKLKIDEIILRESETDMCLCEDKDTCRMGKCQKGGNQDESIEAHSSATLKTSSSCTNLNSNQTHVVDNNNNTNNNSNSQQDYINSEQVSRSEQINNISKPRFKTSSSSSSLSSSTSSLNQGNTDLIENETKNDLDGEDKKLETNFNQELMIESINFEGVRSIKGTDNYRFLIKIRWSDKTFNEIHKTYSELCEFNQQLTSLFPDELNGLIESSQLVFKENQKEDFVKEMPLVAEYCSKLAALPKEICKSNFLRNFFRSNPVVEANKNLLVDNQLKSDTDPSTNQTEPSQSNPTEPKHESPTTNETTISSQKQQPKQQQQLNQSTSQTNIQDTNSNKNQTNNNNNNNNNLKAKNVVVSVASVMNQKQQPQQQYPVHQNLNKMIQMGPFVNQAGQFINPVFQQLNLHTFQPIAPNQHMAISSPPCASPTPQQQQQQQQQAQFQNYNSSHSLNNSRSSSPWMMSSMPQAQPQNIPYQYKQQIKPNNTTKENKQSSEELLLRYALDNNNSTSNLQSQMSPIDESNMDKNLGKQKSQQIDYRKNSLKSKHNHHETGQETGAMSPKSSSNNLRSSSSCSSSSYQTPPPQQPVQPMPINLHSLQSKQLSSPSSGVFNSNLQQFPHITHMPPPNPHLIPFSNTQLISQQQQQQGKHQPQQPAQSQSPATTVSGSNASLPSLLLAPIVHQGPGMTIPAFAMPPQPIIPASNLSIVTGIGQPPPPPLTVTQPLTIANANAQSPSLASSFSSISSLKNQNKLNQSSNLAVGSLTTSDDDENTNSEFEANSEPKTSSSKSNQRINMQRVHRKSVSSSSSNTTITNKQQAPSTTQPQGSRMHNSNSVSSTNNSTKNISLTSPGGTCSQQIQTTYYYNNSVNEQQAVKLISPASTTSSSSSGKKEKSTSVEEKNDPTKENDPKTSQNNDTDTSNQMTNGIPAKSPPLNQQPIPIVNNLYYPTAFPPFILNDGQNLYTITNGIPPQAPGNNSQNVPPIPFHINPAHLAPHLAPPPHHHHHHPHHPSHLQPINLQQPPPLFLIPNIPPNVNQSQAPATQSNSNTSNNSATTTNNATPTPGSSPNPAPSASQQFSSTNSNENLKNNQTIQPFQMPPDQQLLNSYNVHHMMALAMSGNPQFMMMMMGNPQGPLTLAPGPPTGPGQNPQMMPKQQPSFNQFQQYHPLSTPPPQISPSVNTFNMKNQKKKSCYNCGLMNHTAYECKEPTIESTMAQTNQFRLNFKPTISNNTQEEPVPVEQVNLASPGRNNISISKNANNSNSRPLIKSNQTQS